MAIITENRSPTLTELRWREVQRDQAQRKGLQCQHTLTKRRLSTNGHGQVKDPHAVQRMPRSRQRLSAQISFVVRIVVSQIPCRRSPGGLGDGHLACRNSKLFAWTVTCTKFSSVKLARCKPIRKSQF